MQFTTMRIGSLARAASVCLGAGMLTLAPLGGASAATTAWSGGAGSWFASGNWNNGIPGAADDAIVGNGGTAQINAVAAAQSLSISGGSTVDLQANGRLSPSNGILVGSGGTLTGTGKAGSVAIANGGTLSSGATPGNLMLQGNLVLASGATYLDYLTPSASGTTIVNGTASLGGALVVNAAAGSYTAGQRYKLLTASGGFGGTTFSSFSLANAIPYTLNVEYVSNNVFLSLSPNPIAPQLPSGQGANQSGAATGIDTALAAGAPPSAGFTALLGLSGAALGGAVSQVSGQAGADAPRGATQSFSSFLNMLMAQGGGHAVMTAGNFAPGQGYGADDAPRPAQLDVNALRIWGSVFGQHAGLAADPASGAQSLKAGTAGLAAGIEAETGGGLLIGASVAGDHSSFSAGNGAGSSDDVLLGLYARADMLTNGYIAAALSYGWHDVDTVRIVTVSGTDVLAANYTGNDIGGRIEGGYRFTLDERYALTPYAALVADDFQAPDYSEAVVSGAPDFALNYAAHDTLFAHSELGLRLGRAFAVDAGMLGAEISAAWSHELQNDPYALAAFQSLPRSSFVVHGIQPAADTALLGLNVALTSNGGLAYGVHLESQVGPGLTTIGGSANFAYRW